MKLPIYPILAFAATVTAAPFAAHAVMETEDSTVIMIEVPKEDLARCKETLRQVAQMPVVADDGSHLPASVADNMPGVVCIAKDV